MALSVGDGRSAPDISDYASQDEQIQSALSHKFDEFTNPFLASRNISSVFAPGIQQAQDQQRVGIEQARQNMAQTAQDTLLPLQANYYSAQTDDIRARGAALDYQLQTQKDGASQFPDLMSAVGSAVNNNDPAALASAIGQYPAAVRSNPSLIQDAYNRISQSKQIETQGTVAAAMAKGADYVSANPNAMPTDFESAFTPTPGLTPAQQIQEKNGFLLGASHQQVQAQVASAKGAITLAAAQLRQTGQIDAATIKTLGPLIQKGFFNSDALAAAGVDPDTANQLIAAANGKPNANGSVFPEKIAVQNLRMADSISKNPLASAEQRNWAMDVQNTGGNPSFQLPVYTPAVQDKIDNYTSHIANLQKLYDTQSGSWFTQNAAKDTLKQMGDLKNDLGDLRKNAAQRPTANAPQDIPAPASQPTYNAAAPLSFNSNPFLPPDMNNVSATTVTPVPGNPQTTAAFDLTNGGLQSPPAPSIPGVSPQAQATSTKSIQHSLATSTNTPPPAAVAKLKSDPSLAQAFDAKYGKGAALRYLRE